MNQQHKQEILEPGDKHYKDKEHFSNQQNRDTKKRKHKSF